MATLRLLPRGSLPQAHLPMIQMPRCIGAFG
nr:MAG TPA: hypothetical protein [Caudoviricetes sp.]